MKYIILSLLLLSIGIMGCVEKPSMGWSDGKWKQPEKCFVNHQQVNCSWYEKRNPDMWSHEVFDLEGTNEYVPNSALIQEPYTIIIQPSYEVIPMDECLGIEGVESCDMILYDNQTKITWIMQMDVKQMYSMLGKYLKDKSKNITDEQLRQRNMTRAEFDNTLDSMINGFVFNKESE